MPQEKLFRIRSVIHKRLSWEELRTLLVEVEGLDETIATKIGKFINFTSDEFLYELQKDEDVAKSPDIQVSFYLVCFYH